MGIIAKQSIKNSLSIYAGFIIGGIYTVLLVPKVFEQHPENWGLARLLVSIAMLIVPLVQFSIPNTVIKFYSKYSNEKKGKFIFAVFFWMSILILFSIFVVVFFKNLFIGKNTETLLTQHYFLIIPLFLGYVLFEVFAAFSRVQYKSVLPVFLKEFVFRTYILSLILTYYYQLLTFNRFIVLYAFSYTFIFIIIFINYLKSHKQPIKIDFKFLLSKDMKLIYKYAFFLLLSTGAAMITLNIDNIMINSYLSIPDIAIYSVWFYLATTLSVPLRSITGIAAPVISKCFTDNDTKTIQTIYKKSSVTPLVISIFLFLILWFNVDLIKVYFGNTFGKNERILLYIAIGNLFNVAAGVNGTIITLSKYYKTDIVFQLLLVGFIIITNIIFIPHFQIEGVAMATALSLILINMLRLVFVYFKLKMQPFSKQTLLLLIFTSVIFIISLYFKPAGNIINNVIYTIILSVLYVSGIYFLNISKEINSEIDKFLFRKK